MTIYFVMNLIGIGAIVVSVLRLAGVGQMFSRFPFVDIANLVIFSVFLVLTGILLFGGTYRFDERSFVIRQAFAKIVIDRDRITRFLFDEASGIGALYYVNPLTPEMQPYVTVVLRSKDVDDFIDDLRSLRSDVTVEVHSAPPSVNV